MILFGPTDPFIREIDAQIQADGGAAFDTIRHNGVETLYAGYLPTLEHGILFQDLEGNGWEQADPRGEEENLMIVASSDRRVTIQTGDDGFVCLECTLRAAAELHELLEFFSTAKACAIGNSSVARRPLSSFVEKVFLGVPGKDDSGFQLLPLGSQSTGQLPVKLVEMVDAWFLGDVEKQHQIGFWHFGSFLDAHELRESIPELFVVNDDDIFVDSHGMIRYARAVVHDPESALGHSPCMVLRIKKEASRMWISDFLEYGSEAEGIVDALLGDWKRVAQKLKEVSVSVHAQKRDQVAHAIELRRARLGYMGAVRRLSSIREPFQDVALLFRKRTRALELVHGEALDDIQSIQRPLPFFLEYPYRTFRKEDDHVRRVRSGQRLLGLLIKVPLYLVIEELLAGGAALGEEALAKIEERPLSDGGVLELRKYTAKELSNRNTRLMVFSDLADILSDSADLDAMVAARNRMHHEPFDEVSFLSTMEMGVPRLIDALRDALHDVHFLVPQHGRKIGGEKKITAEDVRSAEAHFRKVELVTTLALEAFPAETLVAWRKDREVTLELGRLVTSKLVAQQSRDFGIFDRMQKSERCFAFLRSE